MAIMEIKDRRPSTGDTMEKVDPSNIADGSGK